jgi:hypothetical protein
MLHDELGQEVAKLRRLGLIGGGVVLHGLCPTDVVDPNQYNDRKPIPNAPAK